jgi:hypothetical protein
MRVVYYNASGAPIQSGFRGTAAAWSVRPVLDRAADERLAELAIAEPLYQALFNLGIVDRLATLPHSGMLGRYEEGELSPEGLSAADAMRAGRLEWVCGQQLVPEPVEYRLVVDAEVVRSQLRDLAAFVRTARLQALAVQLWL